ncbi:MAG: Ltp family lipoprotein [Brevibacterium sp.]|nr:Ltp family lipoprotein [Brevibacterium sp.]
MMHMSKGAIFDLLTSEYGGQFTEDAAQYAADHLNG